MNTQLALSTADVPSPIDAIEEEFSRLSAQLRVFTRIPKHHHDVTALLGLVLVYETDTLCRDGLEEGALYVVESQHPVAGMSWETYDRFNLKRDPREGRVRLETKRRVVRLIRPERDPKHWYHVLPSGWHDGPFIDEWRAAQDFVGKVVGIYVPGGLEGRL